MCVAVTGRWATRRQHRRFYAVIFVVFEIRASFARVVRVRFAFPFTVPVRFGVFRSTAVTPRHRRLPARYSTSDHTAADMYPAALAEQWPVPADHCATPSSLSSTTSIDSAPSRRRPPFPAAYNKAKLRIWWVPWVFGGVLRSMARPARARHDETRLFIAPATRKRRRYSFLVTLCLVLRSGPGFTLIIHASALARRRVRRSRFVRSYTALSSRFRKLAFGRRSVGPIRWFSAILDFVDRQMITTLIRRAHWDGAAVTCFAEQCLCLTWFNHTLYVHINFWRSFH